jgi:hypothetical protein
MRRGLKGGNTIWILFFYKYDTKSKGEKCVSWEIKKLAKYIMFPTLPILQIMQTFNDSSCQTFDPFQNSSKKQTS